MHRFARTLGYGRHEHCALHAGDVRASQQIDRVGQLLNPACEIRVNFAFRHRQSTPCLEQRAGATAGSARAHFFDCQLVVMTRASEARFTLDLALVESLAIRKLGLIGFSCRNILFSDPLIDIRPAKLNPKRNWKLGRFRELASRSLKLARAQPDRRARIHDSTLILFYSDSTSRSLPQQRLRQREGPYRREQNYGASQNARSYSSAENLLQRLPPQPIDGARNR
jgi:hypothetical protein